MEARGRVSAEGGDVRANPAADTGALEAEIDRLVYGLYGLTEEEVKIVENKT